jgi:hypothetical protein
MKLTNIVPLVHADHHRGLALAVAPPHVVQMQIFLIQLRRENETNLEGAANSIDWEIEKET